jgi:hypothetical protein
MHERGPHSTSLLPVSQPAIADIPAEDKRGLGVVGGVTPLSVHFKNFYVTLCNNVIHVL